MKLPVRGTLVNYQVTGDGECLILIHGMGHSMDDWGLQVAAFSRRYRVLTYDVRGHGQTGIGGVELSQELWLDDLCEFLKALKIGKAHVLGHSMGGGIAANLAVKHPEVVKALILSHGYGVGPFSEAEIENTKKRWEAQLATMDEKDDYRKVIIALMRRMPPDFTKITCLTLIIVGQHEGPRGPDAGRRVQQMIAVSELKVLPTGHDSFLEQPAAYNATVLEF